MDAHGQGTARNGEEPTDRKQRQHGTQDRKKNPRSGTTAATTATTTAAVQAQKQKNAEQQNRPENLWEKASLWSRCTFSWVMPVLLKGLEKNDLRENDLPSLAQQESSQFNLRLIDSVWKDEQKLAAAIGRKPNLKIAILKHTLRKMWIVQPLMLLASLAKITQSLALGRLIRYLEGRLDRAGGYWSATLLVLSAVVSLFATHNVFFITWRTGMQLRLAAVAYIYDKTLRLGSVFSSDKTDSGQIMNLASNDVERFLLSTVFLSHLFWGPVEAVAVLIVGIISVGPAFAAGYTLLLLFIFVQIKLGTKFAQFRSVIAGLTDKRVTMISQAVAGIRVVKMMGWELAFVEKINALRKSEASEIQKANKRKAWNEAIFFATNITISTAIFMIHVHTGNELKPQQVFTTFTLLNIVQLTMAKFFAFGVMTVAETKASIERIQTFLETAEISADEDTVIPNDRICLQMRDVTCHWNRIGLGKLVPSRCGKDTRAYPNGQDSSTQPIAVANINLECKRGTLYCIVGPVGSGKSALVQAICGELQPTHGFVSRGRYSMAYAPQDAFIMDGTVRDNILFGLPYKDDWYNEVVKACGLDVDFAQFQFGDCTIVGDRGVQCSGGQRARIGFARALYRDADILIADDPLSAVDARVGNLLFHEAIERIAVERGACVILATHQQQYLSYHQCLVMDAGRIVCRGAYTECADRTALRGTNDNVDAVKRSSDSQMASSRTATSADRDDTIKSSTVAATLAGGEDGKQLLPQKMGRDVAATLKSKAPQQNDQQETKEAGKVTFSTFTSYAKAMGGPWVALSLLMLYVISQTAALVSIAEIGKWAERPASEQTNPTIIGLILGLSGSVVILSIVRAVSVFYCAIKASQRLHNSMTRAVLRSKIEFFDTNPIGRILNRFSADIGLIDDALPHTLYDFFACFFLVVGAITTAASVLPSSLVIMPFLIWYFIRIRRIFLTSSRELKRLEALARSPIFAMLSESLSGISTIRSNGAVDFYKTRFQEVQDSHSRASFIFISGSRWLGFRLDGIVVILLSFACFLSVVIYDFGWVAIDPALIGLALTLLIMMAGLFQWAVRQSAELVNQMISVERITGYTKLVSEAPLETKTDQQHPDWPSKGGIVCQDLSIRYRDDLPPALHRISFNVHGGERIGCVGRTGSGKSSLIQALVRILEAETGRMSVDGVDLSLVGLHKLRHSISVIPQSPVLFSGSTVRENIDPFHKHSDEAIKSALSDVQMWNVVGELPGGLNATVAENGSNFSVGQRQLLCLARAILRRTKILVLDEPSANVDNDTDVLLQEAVAANFQHSTIIAVAHRLDTVIEYDKILVLGEGRVLEFDTPINLIRKRGSFTQMVHDTGERSSDLLTKRASTRPSVLKMPTELGSVVEGD